ncbi:MAG: amino-acid N-acetyltransferase [Gammaproteobacteria bacterium]|nr:amino-acid N-acetyltransferase [Gammaproteobacteria bacterium]MDH5800791.1 amino-acid N-acetyltransferase [Gammaproteobacteria bacterium]
MSQTSDQEFITLFRNSAPYINKFRGKTFVIVFNGETIAADNFPHLIHDFALLNSLGIKLVLVHGARPQIEQKLNNMDAEFQYEGDARITDSTALLCVKEAVGCIRLEIESLLSMGLANSPMAGAKLRVAGGNFITAQPYGIRDGIDFQHTGEVRKIDIDAIQQRLDAGAIVLLSPVGYSPTGEIFNLLAEDVAKATAASLKADKLIYLTESGLYRDGQAVKELSVAEAQMLLNQQPKETQHLLRDAIFVCNNGVARAHILERRIDGVLLQELFTRDGVGTLINSDLYQGKRQATIDDVSGILELIEPLEQEGILVRRSREKLEMEISRFYVTEKDGMIIACGAAYPYPEQNTAELACFAVHPNYRKQGLGDELLEYIQNQCTQQNITTLFVLSTHTAHWFQERGFVPMDLTDLPVERKRLYNYQRKSKMFRKTLAPSLV